MIPKPKHLQPHYGRQFEDESVAAVYRKRPPYPTELFDTLVGLMVPGPEHVLDLGSGTGEIAIPLSERVESVDAVEPSMAMLKIAISTAGDASGHVRWINEPAESFVFGGPYALVVAAQSLHWMDWYVVMPKIWSSLRPGGFLAIVTGGDYLEMPWISDVLQIIPRYSTNVDYEPYDLIAELEMRGLFRELGRMVTAPVEFAQSVEDYLESNHSRNGLSRDRMPPGRAQDFDDEVRRIVAGHSRGGRLSGYVQFTLTWGRAAHDFSDVKEVGRGRAG